MTYLLRGVSTMPHFLPSHWQFLHGPGWVNMTSHLTLRKRQCQHALEARFLGVFLIAEELLDSESLLSLSSGFAKSL